jgi:CHAT domain-containing protein
MRFAQLAKSSDWPFDQPHYWAAFVFTGDPN